MTKNNPNIVSTGQRPAAREKCAFCQIWRDARKESRREKRYCLREEFALYWYSDIYDLSPYVVLGIEACLKSLRPTCG